MNKKKMKKNVKITKRAHTFEILNSFNPELQLKGTESAIKNKLKQLLSELREFNS